MRIIVEAFKDALELGLAKHGQIVVRIALQIYLYSELTDFLAYDPNVRLWLAVRKRDRQHPRCRPRYVAYSLQ